MSINITYNGTTTSYDSSEVKLNTKDKYCSDFITVSGGEGVKRYHFFDHNDVELTDISVSGLATAATYTKDGSAKQNIGGRIFHIEGDPNNEDSIDHFYVVDNTAFSPNLKWCSGSIIQQDYVSAGIGAGKLNSAKGLAAYATDSGSIWEWLKQRNDNFIGGYNDWFIPSKVELVILAFSKVTDWFLYNDTNKSYFHTCCLLPDDYDIYVAVWNYWIETFDFDWSKLNTFPVCVLRAF